MNVEVWDFSGTADPRKQSTQVMYFRNALAALVVFDISDYKENELLDQIEYIQQQLPGVLVVLVANCTDKLDG